MKINYNIPLSIASELMDYMSDYAEYKNDYIHIYRRYMLSGDLEKSWAKDVIEEYFSRLEFTWDKICQLVEKLSACSKIIGIDNHYVFISIVRLYKKIYDDNFMAYACEKVVEMNVEALKDNPYNGGQLSPHEIRAYIRKNKWDMLK